MGYVAPLSMRMGNGEQKGDLEREESNAQGLEVTLVIPARNAASTLDACLSSVVPMLESGDINEIIFVDDRSTDETAEIARRFPVRYMQGTGTGAASARNIGWRAARTPLVWFVDSDCVAARDALPVLLKHMEDPDVAGVGGSYGIMNHDSLLASLIHEEIAARHQVMPNEVDFLATFNVIYRRDMLEKVGGFDEKFYKAQDAELAYRIKRAGGKLGFDRRSFVNHYHPVSLRKYMKVQEMQGYWRAFLYFEYPEMMKGDTYSGFSDHVQPILALLSIAMSPTLLLGPLALVQLPVVSALAAAQVPMTARIVAQTGETRYVAFAAMSMLRAYARGFGFFKGLIDSASKKKVER